jgi:hypothetical protein
MVCEPLLGIDKNLLVLSRLFQAAQSVVTAVVARRQ